MTTGVDIRLEPVPMSTTGSGELFKFRLKNGTTFSFEIDNYTTISTSDGGTVTTQFFPVESEKMLTLLEMGNGMSEVIFKIPVKNIRYIQCYYE